MKRPLAVFGFTYLIMQMAIILLPQELFIVLAVVFSVAFIIVFLFKPKYKLHIIVIVSALILGFSLNYIYNLTYIKPSQDLIGKELDFTATVISSSDGYNEEIRNVQLKINAINENGQNTNVNFYTSALMPYVGDGDVLSFTAVVNEIEDEWKLYNYSNAVFVSLSDVENLKHITSTQSILHIADDIQFKLAYNIDRFIPSSAGSIINAMSLGYDGYLTKSIEEVFRSAGVSHVLVVSGLHLSLVSAVVYFLLCLFMRKRLASFFTILFILLFVMISGITPSAIRACVSIILIFSAKIFSRKSDIYTSLGFAALILCIHNPYASVDVGTLLSFSATLGVLSASNYISERQTARKAAQRSIRLRDMCIESVALPFAASIATLPILSAFGFGISLVGTITNILISPFIPLIVISGMVISLLAEIEFLFYITRIIAVFIAAITNVVYFIASVFANIPGAYIHITGISAVIIILCAIALIFIGFKLKLNKKLNAIFAVLFIIIGGAFYFIYSSNVAHIETVGSGTQPSLFIMKNTRASLIFSGRDTDIDEVQEICEKYNISKLDLIVDLRRSETASDLSEYINYNELIKAELLLNNTKIKIYDDIFINIHHQENGNYAGVSINETTIGISSNRVDMNAFENCDIFILGSGKPENLYCDTLLLTDNPPSWWFDERPDMQFNDIKTANKLFIRTNSDEFKWEEDFFDIS